jgi:hypothetical protein
MDVVDTHNLNRQILYRHEHVGKKKVLCAQEELLRHHNVNNAKIEAHDMDAVVNWKKTVELIKSVDIVFNTIDYGDYFDYAVSQVCNKYDKIMVLGGTEPFYGHTVSYFLQGIRKEEPKFWDTHELSAKDILAKLNADEIESHDNISFMPKDSHPVKGGSTVYSAGTCSFLMVDSVVNYLMAHADRAVRSGAKKTEVELPKEERLFPPKMTIFNLMNCDMTSWY